MWLARDFDSNSTSASDELKALRCIRVLCREIVDDHFRTFRRVSNGSARPMPEYVRVMSAFRLER
jgi:hypothetical protein